MSNGVATAHAAVASGGTEVKRASADASAASPGTPDARGADAKARRLEPAASPIGELAAIKRKKSYTFGVYKATKIALGLKKPKTVAVAGDATSSFRDPNLAGSNGDASRRVSGDACAGASPGPAPPAVDVPKGPWHVVEDPAPWSGPPVPTAGPDDADEPFMTAAAKTHMRGFALQPWEGVAVTGPAVLAVIDCGLVDSSVRPELNRPDTKHMPEDARGNMRRAGRTLETPFAFALRLRGRPDQRACDRFLPSELRGGCTLHRRAPGSEGARR